MVVHKINYNCKAILWQTNNALKHFKESCFTFDVVRFTSIYLLKKRKTYYVQRIT